MLHMHAAAGREGRATVGCTRAGVDVWLVGEVVLLEILGTEARRRKDPQTGFQLLTVGPEKNNRDHLASSPATVFSACRGGFKTRPYGTGHASGCALRTIARWCNRREPAWKA